MRWLTCALLLAACGPKVSPKAVTFDEDLASAQVAGDVPTPTQPDTLPDAPPGKGLRNGTIERAKLVAVLDSGPGNFLRQFEVTARLDGNRFVGWQLVQLVDRGGPLVDLDLLPGDVLLAVNGKPISKPDQLQAVWDSLRTANEVVADLWRGKAKYQLQFAIEPKL